MCPSLIEIGSKTAERNSAQTNKQTNKQTNRHYENNGHLAVNQKVSFAVNIRLSLTYIENKPICAPAAIKSRVLIISRFLAYI